MRISIWDARTAEVYYRESLDRRQRKPEAIRLLVDDNRDNRAVIWLHHPGLASAIHSASLEAIDGLAAYELSKLGCIAPDIEEEVSWKN